MEVIAAVGVVLAEETMEKEGEVRITCNSD